MKNYLIKIGNCIVLCFFVVMFSHKIFCQQVDIQNQVDLMVSDEKGYFIGINNLLNLRNGFKKESFFRPDTIVILNKNVDEKFRFLYSYDSITNGVTETCQVRTGDGWSDQFRYVYIYDKFYRLIEKLKQNILDGKWDSTQRNIYTYSKDSNKITSNKFQIKLMPNNWHTAIGYSYGYDEEGKLISDYYESWMGYKLDNTKNSIYYYDDGSKFATRKTLIWYKNEIGCKNNREDMDYGEDIYYYTYEYDDIGRKVKEIVKKENSYEITSKRWIYKDDEYGNLLSLSEEFLDYSTWRKNFTRTYVYDMDGKILNDKYEKFKWNNYNVITDRLEFLEFEYDDFGNIICVKSVNCNTPYFYYNNMSNKWMLNFDNALKDSYMMKINYIDINKSDNIYDVASEKYDIKFYPNPVKNTLFVNGYDDNFYFVLTDFNGKICLEGYGSKSIDVSGVKRGLYILRLIIKDQIVLSKILIE